MHNAPAVNMSGLTCAVGGYRVVRQCCVIEVLLSYRLFMVHFRPVSRDKRVDVSRNCIKQIAEVGVAAVLQQVSLE